ncbi:MAG: hypothetical protein V9G04_19215 [Nocardioides sp.]
MKTGSRTFWGIPLSADVGGLIGLIFGGALIGGVIDVWRRRRAKKEEELARAEALRAEADRLDAETKAENYRVHMEALQIHESLTSREVFDALSKIPTDQPAEKFLIATYDRGQSRYVAFSSAADLDPKLDSLVTRALAEIAAPFPQLKSAQQEVKRKQNERSKYFVGDVGPLSKHLTIHLIAQRFTAQHKIRTVAQFKQEFGALVRQAVGETVGKASFVGDTLLEDPSTGSASYQRRYAERDRKVLDTLGAIELDGVRYLAGWKLGYDREIPDMGRLMHQAFIEHIRTLDGFKDIVRA